ncbi:sensor histidine kinase [Haloferula sp.]|uniref:sensor histidine kinase n=1 Tax=Haloferula sp. TaxID=2497595 RepID=UPI003C71E5A6
MKLIQILRRHPWPVFLGLWTIGVIWIVVWLFNRPPAEPIIIRSEQVGDTGGWPLFDRTFYPVYPWILLAPWVIWLCLRFPIGLRRTWLALPLVLLGAASFVYLSYRFASGYGERLPQLVYLSVTRLGSMPQVLINGEELPSTQSSKQKDSSEQPVKIDLQVEGLKDLLAQLEDQLGLPLDEEQISKQIERAMVNPAARGPNAEVTVIAKPAGSKSMTVDGSGVIDIPKLQTPDLSKITQPNLVLGSMLHLGGFVLIGGLVHLGVFLKHIRDREQRHTIVSKELAEARLSELHAQLRPHFLFNALNSISSEVHESPEKAVDMIIHLSDLLRGSLTIERGNGLIPLRNELALLDHYLALQSHRFGDRLTVHRDFPADTLVVPVPPFVLQPLVENAVQHGLEPLARPGNLWLSSELENGELVIQIEDDGTGLNASPATKGTGTGLSNIRSRLETLFPERHRLLLEPASPEQGTRVTLRLPLS